MKRVIKSAEEYESLDDILCMSNVRGKYIKNPHRLPFSFYFSSNNESQHSIRVKVVFDPEKLKSSLTGIQKLSDDWAFTPGKNDGSVSKKDIAYMQEFFKHYIVLFAAVWDEQLQDATLEDYFKGDISFHEMLEDFDFYLDYQEELDNLDEDDIVALEDLCRKYHIVNFYGN